MTLIYVDRHLRFSLLELLGEDSNVEKTSALAHNQQWFRASDGKENKCM